ncbi:hypothetical protein LTS18_008540 [Coniosporium uncinatum]|uniref:Uncharacterized protein n=1 Tax=Coniosporium uncinatum TaxID=93489 RepID=A0ACC3D224_9PEZI|nr:hypothetical protein LTS18_008540 [Coniosporium uncinatum]
MFFDVLMIDDDRTLGQPHTERRKRLRELISKRQGRAMTTEWKTIDFSEKDSDWKLCTQFAASITSRCEGLILKPADSPYFSLDSKHHAGRVNGFIKLKKDYMQDLGEERDMADFAVVGGSYDSKQAQAPKMRGLRWTTFHLGCLQNEDAVRFGHKPVFKIVEAISQDHCIPAAELKTFNDVGRFHAHPFVPSGKTTLVMERLSLLLDNSDASRLDVVFTEPIVAEVLGSGFEKPSNKGFYMLRHPRILKVHLDRTWREAVSVEQLAHMAKEARMAPAEGESQERARLLLKMRARMERKVEREGPRALSTPRSTTRSPTTPAPISLPSSRKSEPRRSKTSPAPLVRVDTAEQMPGQRQPEQRCIDTPCPQKVPRSNLPLPTPPTSSSEIPATVPGNEQRTAIVEQAHANNRKRLADASIAAPTATIPVKRRKSTPTAAPSRSNAGNVAKPASQPLADITHLSSRANQTLNTYQPPAETQSQDLTTHASADTEKRRMKSSKLPRFTTPVQGTCSYHEADTSNTKNLPCPLAKAAVYLSPDISHYKWVSEDLLTSHGAYRIAELQFWNREITGAGPLDDEVSESQAYIGMTKIVLVEAKREKESEMVGGEVRRLGRVVGEGVWVFDWRVLEAWAGVEVWGHHCRCRSQDWFNETWRRHVFGKAHWDADKNVVMWEDGEQLVKSGAWCVPGLGDQRLKATE